MLDTRSTILTRTEAALESAALRREIADEHKPKARQLLDEGLDPNAVFVLFCGRDALLTRTPSQVVAHLNGLHELAPFDEAGVWPNGAPSHWTLCGSCGECVDDCGCISDDFDGAPDQQWQVTEGGPTAREQYLTDHALKVEVA